MDAAGGPDNSQIGCGYSLSGHCWVWLFSASLLARRKFTFKF